MWLVARSPVRTPSFQHDSSRLGRRRPVRRCRLTRLWPEILEDRALLSSIFTVTDNSDSPTDTGSLRYAINNATSGSTIEFASSVTSPITLANGVLTIGTNLDIEGPGANNLTITGNNTSGIFSVASGTTATIAGLTLTNGISGTGGAILNDGTLTLNNCTVAKSTATYGGGIDNNGTLAANNCTISNNSAAGGGGLFNNAALTLTNCTVANNSAVNAGGIYNLNPATLSLADCTIADNSATSAGGGVINTTSASTVLANTIIAGNTAPSPSSLSGPDVNGVVTSLGYNLIGNTSGGSGFVATDLQNVNPLVGAQKYNGGSTPTMELLPGSPAIDAGNNTLAIGPSGSPLTADQRGFTRIANGTVDIGAFEVQVYMAYSTVDSGGGSLRTALGHANQGGGSVVVITATGVIELASALPPISSDVQILGPGANNLTVSGSGTYQVFNITSGVSVAMAGLTISGGAISGSNGGGIANAGTLSLTNCTVADNAAVAVTGVVSGDGGGIANTGTLTMTKCAVAYNTAAGILGVASGDGGGIANTGTLSLINCTIADNSAVGAADGLGGDGGGIANSGMLTLSDCTIAGNSAAGAAGLVVGDGGGIANSGSATLANTIVATNTATGTTPNGPDVYGTVTSQGYNLIGNSSGSSGFVATDLLNVNPVIGILQNNGGPTQTIAVLPGSPAIAAGSVALIPAGITTDQRGLPRTFNGKVDIGAFQSRGFTIAVSGGTNQQTFVNTVFPSPLLVLVSSPFGDPVLGGLVTFTAPASGPSATFPNGNTARIDSSGLAGLAVAANTSAGSYSISASANGTTGTGLSFNLTNVAGPASQLAIHTQPSSTAVAGQLFATQPVIYEEDQYGNLETKDNSTKVVASLHNSNTSLQTVTVVGGVATFSSLSYTKAGSITLDFTSGTLTKVTSNAIAIKAAAAVKFVLHIPSTGIFATGTPYTIIVLAQDAYGNQAGGYRGTIQFTSTKVATLPGFYSFTAADNGVHTFTNGVIYGQTGTVTITVYDTATPSITGSITVSVGSGSAAAARVAATKAKSRRLARGALAASAKLQAHTAVKLQSGNSSKAQQNVVAAGGALHQASVIARHVPAIAQADAVREHILAELRGSLRAYLAAERLANSRLE